MSSAHPVQPSQVDQVPLSPVVATSSYSGWDRALARFLKNAGLMQALSGFENDMLVMNLECEKEDVLPALEQLRNDFSKIAQNDELPDAVMEERKLGYVHLANNATPVSQSQLTRSISAFIAQNRARNNTSNRNEFLRKRPRVDSSDNGTTAPEGSSTMQDDLPTCARTDALPVNRDVQMRYDIAKNEGGPLKRTVKPEQADVNGSHNLENRNEKGKRTLLDEGYKPTLQLHPGLGERFANLESHLAVRYVPLPPVSLLDRLRFIEEHIVRLERDYPPWAALHFNQPNRGWPPPPRATPLIVPSHLTSTNDLPGNVPVLDSNQSGMGSAWTTDVLRTGNSRDGTTRPRARGKLSSLHRAVMQKLEVKKALAGED